MLPVEPVAGPVPATGARALAPAAGLSAPGEAGSRRRAILVIDDEPWILDLARELLRADGYEVVTALGGQAALERLGQQAFDVIVSCEMLEHMKNYDMVLAKVSSWLRPDGRMMVQILGNRRFAYDFKTTDWMGKYFFAGGTMPKRGCCQRINASAPTIRPSARP